MFLGACSGSATSWVTSLACDVQSFRACSSLSQENRLADVRDALVFSLSVRVLNAVRWFPS